MCEKEPKFKVGQRVRCRVLGIEGVVVGVNVIGTGMIVVDVRVDPAYGKGMDYQCRMRECYLEAVEGKPSPREMDFSELEQRIMAHLAHAAGSQFIEGFNKLREALEDDSDDEATEPAIEAMSMMDGLREIVSGLPAHGSGRISEIRDEAVQQIDDLSEVIDELIEQRDAARAEGPEYEFTEEGRTIAPLFVPPGSVATWLFGMGMIETVTGHVDGKKCFEFGVSETPAAPGDVLTGARSREPRIRMVFHDDEAIHRVIADLVLLANGKVQRRANDAE